MSLRDVGLALLATLVWGLSFIAIKLGVAEAPPFLLSALRFFFAAVPMVFFVRAPAAPIRLIVLYGLFIGVGQFGLLFLAIRLGMPVGLSSLVIQAQVFMTIALAWVLRGERPSRVQIVASLIALAGVCTIAYARLSGASFLPFALTIAAAFCWAAGNLTGKFAGRVDALAFTAWSSLVAPLPMLALSFAFEGDRTLPALLHPTWTLALSIAALSYGGTLFSYGVWSRLLMRYPAATVAPYALLIPIVGMGAARLLFAEQPSAIEFGGALLIMAGLGFNILADRLQARFRRSRDLPCTTSS